ncbi:hypothetical protein COL0001_06230 [Helicobacter pylori]
MGMVVGSEEMENADNGNECFMPVFSNEQDEKSFFLAFEFKYDLNEEDKQCLIELVPIKYNNNL